MDVSEVVAGRMFGEGKLRSQTERARQEGGQTGTLKVSQVSFEESFIGLNSAIGLKLAFLPPHQGKLKFGCPHLSPICPIPNEASLLRLVTAVLVELSEEWEISNMRYLVFEN